MRPEEIASTADRLAFARSRGAVLERLVPDGAPLALDEGFRVQAALHARHPEPTVGWLVGLTNQEMQRRFGVAAPYYAPLAQRNVHASPATIDTATRPPLGLECEVAVRLATDLPPGPRPHSTEEVAAAVAAIAPAIEVVAGHLARWWERPLAEVVADNGTDGPLVIGREVTDWRAIDVADTEVALELDGEIVACGTTGAAMGGAIAVLTWLANRLNRHGTMLRAGEIVNTGTCTPLVLPERSGRAVARFGSLGDVAVDLV